MHLPVLCLALQDWDFFASHVLRIHSDHLTPPLTQTAALAMTLILTLTLIPRIHSEQLPDVRMAILQVRIRVRNDKVRVRVGNDEVRVRTYEARVGVGIRVWGLR